MILLTARQQMQLCEVIKKIIKRNDCVSKEFVARLFYITNASLLYLFPLFFQNFKPLHSRLTLLMRSLMVVIMIPKHSLHCLETLVGSICTDKLV